ncbi:hypothetical protein AMK68_03945 [candidate division KD3-62 bacterium DG_56]|uniref:Uncharacterized protein n=1 Tax=candidate division KD3-62 bacterium DG_56 TaxID=1704032 RepID=A0A0S7XLT0_9BACT|nr:MAG: hypothetical protein AMK68_03945 [candidate division KD3-62 bacterium DG_56]
MDISSSPKDWAWVMVGVCGRVPEPYDPDVTTWPAASLTTEVVWGTSPPPIEPATWLPTSDCSGLDAWHQGYLGLPLSGYLIGERYYTLSPSVEGYCGVPADTDILRPGEGYWLDIEYHTIWLQLLPVP